VFAAAHELPLKDRAAWLAIRCADQDWLRIEVEGLLSFAPAEAVPQEPEWPARMSRGRLLGRGGFSDVYAVIDETWGPIAVKRLRTLSGEALLHFKNEFRLVKERLGGCPYIVRLHELLEYGSEWLLLMEQLHGETLRERLDHTSATLDPSAVNKILAQIADGLNALHRVGILHRDLKPGNVWIKPGDYVVLLDFGLATRAERQPRDPSLELFGTMGYVAPERMARKADSAAGDWFSAGVMLFEMLGGSVPANGIFGNPLPFPPETPTALAALCTALLRSDPERRAGAREVAAYLAGAGHAPTRSRLTFSGGSRLIGREKEFQRLQECFRKTTQGQPVCVFLTGESGSGKTELAEAFLSSLSPAALTLRGRCYEAGSVPFKACDAVVDEIATLLRRMPLEKREARLPRNMHVLERVFPVLAGLRQAARPRSPDAVEVPRELAFLALRELLGRLAERDRLAVFIDDLHWGDIDSKMALAGLLSGMDSPTALFILAWRTEDAHAELVRWMTENARSFRAEVIEVTLGRLGRQHSENLAAALLGEVAGTSAEDLTGAIAEASGGNPFMIQELAGWERHRRVLSQTGPIVPERSDSLAAALQSRMSLLSLEAGAVLDAIAVAGEALPDTVVETATGVVGSYARAREELIEARLARGVNRGTHADLDIYHARQRETVQAIRGVDAAAIHGRIAAALIEAGTDAQRVYTHLSVSANTAQRAEYAELAADRAIGQLAFEQAATLYRDALRCLPEEKRTHALYRKLAEASAAAGLGAAAAEAYARAAERAPTGGDDLRLSMGVLAAGQLLNSGQLDDGLAAFRQVCGEAGVPYPRSKAALYCSILWLRFKLKRRGLEPRGRMQLTPRRRIQMETCWTGLIGTGLIETTRSAGYSAQHLLWALDAGEPRTLCRAMAVEAAITSAARIAGLPPHTLLDGARKMNAHLEGGPEDAFLDFMGAVVACNEGDWKGSLACAERALAKFAEQGSGAGWERVTASTYWLSARIMTGDWKGVIADLPALLLDAGDRGDHYAAVNLQLLSNCYLAEIGAGRARDAADLAVKLQRKWGQPRYDMQRFSAELTQLDCDLYEGDVRQAWSRFLDVRKATKESELDGFKILKVRLMYSGARCAVALALREQVERRELLREARKCTEWLARCGHRHGFGFGAMMQAAIASIAEDRIAVERHLQVALGCFRDLGMRTAEALCEARLAGSADRASWFAEQEIADPARLLDCLAPGRWVE
jgi:tetratricopeptide (TPR) repeat protein